MSLREDMWKYEQITGESAEHVPIIKLGAFLDGYDMGIKALGQQPCEDCISRQAAIEAMRELPHEYNTKEQRARTGGIAACQTIIRELPSVTPQPKIGRWEFVQYDSNPNIGNWHCSECRTIIPHMPVETDRTPIYKWCPMCGAKMEVEE